jgi:hypothetical protein
LNSTNKKSTPHNSKPSNKQKIKQDADAGAHIASLFAFCFFCAPTTSNFEYAPNARMLGDEADAGGTLLTNHELSNFQNEQEQLEKLLNEAKLQLFARDITRRAIKEGVQEASDRLKREEKISKLILGNLYGLRFVRILIVFDDFGDFSN